jgi:hypothetical protein
MRHALATLLLALSGAASAAGTAPTRVPAVEGAPETAPLRLATPADVVALCRKLEPAERLRGQGDAVAQGEAEVAHARARDEAIVGRYELVVPAAKLPFARYDGGARRLFLERGGFITLEGGDARLWPAAEAGFPVEVEPEGARRILGAQAAGTLELGLVFDLADDATCGSGPSGKSRYTLPVDPVAWRWQSGGEVLARGGAGADRPLVTAAQGASARVAVGEPMAGPRDARRAVEERTPALQACYADALRRNPGVDGVLVAELGGARPAIAADSVGDAELAACVTRALGDAAGAAGVGGTVAVPIRFELVPPSARAGEAGKAPPAAPGAAPAAPPAPAQPGAAGR